MRIATAALVGLLVLSSLSSCGDDDKRARIQTRLKQEAQHPDVKAAIAVAKAKGHEPRWSKLYPVDAMSPTATAIWVLGVNLGLPLLGFVLIAARWMGYALQRRRADMAGAEARAREAAEVGHQTLHGRLVEVVGGGAMAVELRIVQSGRSTTGKNKKTIWSEVQRELTTRRPFIIALENGQRVRVEPDDNVRLVDDLSPGERIGRAERERRAELQVGEEVYVDGLLERDGQQMVMRPHAGRMLLSTRPLSDVFALRARHHRFWAILVLLAIVAVQYVFHKPYLIGALTFGEGTAVVIGKSVKKVKRKRGYSTYYLIHVVIAQTGQVFREAMTHYSWQTLQRGSRVPVVYNPSFARYAQVGPAVAEPFEKIFFSFWLLPLFAGYLTRLSKVRLWYESAKVTDTVPGTMSKWEPPEGEPPPPQSGGGGGSIGSGGGEHIS
ncbi:MAG: hypothetical protein KC503_24885 [Myxococcales bacterium]|nr:hypothetical protein [Myxococcales bacterium]